MNAQLKKIGFKFFIILIFFFSFCRYATGSELDDKEDTKRTVPEPVEVLVPVAVNLGDYRKLTIEVFTEIPEADEHVPSFKTVLSSKIEESKLFERTVKDNTHDLLVKTKIVSFHKASNWRFLLGLAAGALVDSSEGTAVIELIDTKTNKIVGSCRAKAKAQALSDVFGDISDSIVAFLKEAKEKPPVQTITAPQKAEAPTRAQGNNIEAGTNIDKLNKLRKDGVISEDEYKRAKDKIAPPQKDSVDLNKKLLELDDLHKKGILSDDDYNKAKKRVIDLQKLNELRKSGILSEEEYNKAKARVAEK